MKPTKATPGWMCRLAVLLFWSNSRTFFKGIDHGWMKALDLYPPDRAQNASSEASLDPSQSLESKNKLHDDTNQY